MKGVWLYECTSVSDFSSNDYIFKREQLRQLRNNNFN